MGKKNVWKQATALTLALGLSLSTAVISYANVTMNINYSTTVSDTGESRTFMDSLIGITYQTTVKQVADVNTTFRVDRASTSSNILSLSEIQYGYIDGDKFICTYVNGDVYTPNGSNEGKIDADYPIFDKAQVEKDQQAGITDRVYVMVIDGLNNSDWTDNFFAYAFRLSGSGTTAPSQSVGWVQDATGWWYRNADGSYPVNTWKEISGKQYYFDDNGYMLHDTTTPDGYLVGGDGAWIE